MTTVTLSAGLHWDCPVCGERNIEPEGEAPERVVCSECEDEFEVRMED